MDLALQNEFERLLLLHKRLPQPLKQYVAQAVMDLNEEAVTHINKRTKMNNTPTIPQSELTRFAQSALVTVKEISPQVKMPADRDVRWQMNVLNSIAREVNTLKYTQTQAIFHNMGMCVEIYDELRRAGYQVIILQCDEADFAIRHGSKSTFSLPYDLPIKQPKKMNFAISWAR